MVGVVLRDPFLGAVRACPRGPSRPEQQDTVWPSSLSTCGSMQNQTGPWERCVRTAGHTALTHCPIMASLYRRVPHPLQVDDWWVNRTSLAPVYAGSAQEFQIRHLLPGISTPTPHASVPMPHGCSPATAHVGVGGISQGVRLRREISHLKVARNFLRFWGVRATFPTGT